MEYGVYIYIYGIYMVYEKLSVISGKWMTGWWYTYPSEKYEFVSWDDYSQYMGKQQMFQTTNQKSYLENG